MQIFCHCFVALWLIGNLKENTFILKVAKKKKPPSVLISRELEHGHGCDYPRLRAYAGS